MKRLTPECQGQAETDLTETFIESAKELSLKDQEEENKYSFLQGMRSTIQECIKYIISDAVFCPQENNTEEREKFILSLTAYIKIKLREYIPKNFESQLNKSLKIFKEKALILIKESKLSFTDHLDLSLSLRTKKHSSRLLS
ncbi:hypothetical protein HON22_05635 [Candidatus Peregrinibacteria bacterium]|jgi:hypothetical protein|nr:hypothetical protein [Candidatus Peregrinibacteria bacterium]